MFPLNDELRSVRDRISVAAQRMKPGSYFISASYPLSTVAPAFTVRHPLRVVPRRVGVAGETG